MISRDDLIAAISKASSPKPLQLDVAGIGPVYVKLMTAFDADQTKKKLEVNKKDDGCDVGRLLAAMLCDEEGALLFDSGNAEQVLMLSKLPPGAQGSILNAANEANDPGK
jgi:hypothetical protein